MTEEWKPIPSWPAYEASTLGRIRRGCPGKGTATGAILASRPNQGGYLWISLRRRGLRKKHTCLVSRLVCEAFHGPAPSPKHEAAHGNGNQLDNASGNLRWANRAEQLEDMRRHGSTTALRGERNPRAVLTAEAVRAIRSHPKTYGYRIVLGDEYGVKPGTIGNIAAGHGWPSVK